MKRVFPFLIPLVVCAVAWSMLGCSPQRDPPQSDYEQANQMIEQGKYNSAISLMEDHLRSSSADQKARVIMASAYAARAGLFLRDYLTFADGVLLSNRAVANGTVPADVYDQLRRSIPSRDGKQIVTAMEQIEISLHLVSEVLVKFEEIPNAGSPSQFDDIQKAVQVLDQDPSLVGGPALYRGLLRLVTIRYRVQHFQDFSHIQNCSSDWTVVEQWVTYFHDELNLVLHDFSQGLRRTEQKKSISHLRAQMDQAFQQLQEHAPQAGVACP